jgi:TolB-like protein
VNEFFNQLRQRKLVQWALAYIAAAFALIQVLDVVAQRFGWPDQIEKLLILALAIGFFVALVLAWYHGERGAQRVTGTELLILALLLAIGGGMLWRMTPAPQKTSVANAAKPAEEPTASASAESIAVLPFENLSNDKDNEFFSDGLSEEILNSLSRIDGLQVIARTSSFQFKGKDIDVRIVGARLGVANILEGSVRREGDHARVSAQLVRASDGVQLWSQSYDRTVKDSLAVQLDIAEQVAGVMNVVLDDRQRERMRNAGVKNVDAFIAYQKGWKLYIDAHRDPSIDLLEGLRRSNAEFDQAIALEPNFSFAYYAKADLYEHTLIDDRPTLAERRQAQRAAMQTLERAAATSPDAQQRELALAERQMISDDWRGLANRIDTALAQPGCSAPNWMPVFASAFGYGDRLEPALKRAAECDPLNGINWNTRSWVARADGQPQRMLAILAEDRQRNPHAPVGGVDEAAALAMLGRMDEAKRELAAVPEPNDSTYLNALMVFRLAGDSLAQARTWVEAGAGPPPKIRAHAITTLVEAALFGTRDEANRAAAALDARPAGGLLLATAVSYCDCGAPFDLDATPNFKARLAESGLHWPPTVAMKFPPLPKARP